MNGLQCRYTGRVQGVGFRPTVWKLATELGLRGQVYNDRRGAVVEVWGDSVTLQSFQRRLPQELPPIARLDTCAVTPLSGAEPAGFSIHKSAEEGTPFQVLPDLATCDACLEESASPWCERYRYPLTNCTHCGPRYSIMQGLPYDRSNTSLRDFPLCASCAQEFANPADRRFHAQPIACHRCGPRTILERMDGRALALDAVPQLDDIDAAANLLTQGALVAIQGIGGFHLACDATSADAVQRLRERKHRAAKPFALMGRDRAMIEQWCHVSEAEWEQLCSPVAPIVLLRQREDAPQPLPPSVAPDQNRLGWMVPYTPLHHLLFRCLRRPLVMTSGNRSNEPQCSTLEEARARLGHIADWLLWNERPIVNRVDDSVVRVEGATVRTLRRARGLAPEPLRLPAGFEEAPSVWAMGASLKNTFCRIVEGHALLSPHIGDLHEARAIEDFEHSLTLFERLYPHPTALIATDLHPDYPSTRIGEAWAQERALPLLRVQHHHAHLAACLAEHDVPLDTPPVLGILLDGLGLGSNGELWGGEFLLGSYQTVERVGMFRPTALLGGERAMREPWRNTLAHLLEPMGWSRFLLHYGEALELGAFLRTKPVATFQQMVQQHRNAPLASSAGRLFDAVAGAIGVCRAAVSFEGQAAMRLQVLAEQALSRTEPDTLAYPFTLPNWQPSGLPYLEPLTMWEALLGDLIVKTDPEVIALRFHRGLAQALVQMAQRVLQLTEAKPLAQTVVLSGGVLQNELLAQLLEPPLQALGLQVLRPSRIPCNDGGISLGQAVIAAAQHLIR